jgi:hypothetical protein
MYVISPLISLLFELNIFLSTLFPAIGFNNNKIYGYESCSLTVMEEHKTSWCRVLQKLIVAQLVKKLSAFYGTKVSLQV